MGKKNLSAEEKMAIVMAGIKGDKTVAQICREYGISQYYKLVLKVPLKCV